MTPDEILRRAHEDGSWDEFCKAILGNSAIRDTFDETDAMILERAKRREVLGVGVLDESDRVAVRDSQIDALKVAINELHARNAELEAELTALRERKPNYEAAARVCFEHWSLRPIADVASKIADAAFEPRKEGK